MAELFLLQFFDQRMGVLALLLAGTMFLLLILAPRAYGSGPRLSGTIGAVLGVWFTLGGRIEGAHRSHDTPVVTAILLGSVGLGLCLRRLTSWWLSVPGADSG